jgi:hypothetical protein
MKAKKAVKKSVKAKGAKPKLAKVVKAVKR